MKIFNDHRLTANKQNACLTLLDPGEEIVYPDYGLTEEETNDITALVNAEQCRPSCKVCHDLRKDNRRYSSLYMPKDVNLLAHHMKTRYVCHLSMPHLCY